MPVLFQLTTIYPTEGQVYEVEFEDVNEQEMINEVKEDILKNAFSAEKPEDGKIDQDQRSQHNKGKPAVCQPEGMDTEPFSADVSSHHFVVFHIQVMDESDFMVMFVDAL